MDMRNSTFWIAVLYLGIALVKSQGWYEYDCSILGSVEEELNTGDIIFEVAGGVSVDESRFPYLISLQQQLEMEKMFNHFCGGILLQNDLVLTVAHCLYQKNQFTGSVDYDMRSDPSSSQGLLNSEFNIYAALSPSCRHLQGKGRRPVLQYWIHPQYDGYSIHGNDIAIIKLLGGFQYEDVKPKFDFNKSVDLESVGMTVLGWGATSQLETDPIFSASIVKNLQEAQVSFNPLTTCQTEAQSVNDTFQIVDGQMICFQNPSSDTCSGDSGGPVIKKESNDSDIIIGLTSWGIDTNCSGQGFSGVYTEIAGFKVWIEKVVQEANLPATELGFSQPSINLLPSTQYDSPAPQIIAPQSNSGSAELYLDLLAPDQP